VLWSDSIGWNGGLMLSYVDRFHDGIRSHDPRLNFGSY
jgi:hypothetical protein